jgi:hypothetical protein
MPEVWHHSLSACAALVDGKKADERWNKGLHSNEKRSYTRAERENGKDKKSSIAIVKFISPEMILKPPPWVEPRACPERKGWNCLPRESGIFFFKLKLSRNHFISLWWIHWFSYAEKRRRRCGYYLWRRWNEAKKIVTLDWVLTKATNTMGHLSTLWHTRI